MSDFRLRRILYYLGFTLHHKWLSVFVKVAQTKLFGYWRAIFDVEIESPSKKLWKDAVAPHSRISSAKNVIFSCRLSLIMAWELENTSLRTYFGMVSYWLPGFEFRNEHIGGLWLFRTWKVKWMGNCRFLQTGHVEKLAFPWYSLTTMNTDFCQWGWNEREGAIVRNFWRTWW